MLETVEAASLVRGRVCLQGAVEAGVPDIYAETAAAFLAIHLIRNHAGEMPLVVPGDTPEAETTLQPGEIILRIRVPTTAADRASRT